MNANEAKPVLEVEDIQCGYGGDAVLDGVTFSVKQREIFFIAGRSGCGKTTLLLHLIGLRTPTRGRIAYFGRNFPKQDTTERRELMRSFGVLFQRDALWTDLTLAENVSLPLLLQSHLSKETRDEIAALKLAQVGLAGFENRLPREMSGGMRKRAALARALALDPAILFFDEPTAGLDPITARQIDGLINHVRQTLAATVIVVSHSLASIFRVADRMILLDPEAKGIIASGAPAELASGNTDRRVTEFLGPPPKGHEVEAGSVA